MFWKEDLKHMNKMNLWFLKQGFLENMVVQEPGKVKLSKYLKELAKEIKVYV